jgi:hypothetical protein
VWRDGRRAVLAEAVALVQLTQAGVQLLGNWRREEVVQFERRFDREAGGQRFHRALLEVGGVEEFGEEGDVVFG